MISPDIYESVKKQLLDHDRFVIISHRSPDADSIGSNIALRLVLEQQLGKTVTSACIDPLPSNAFFLPLTDTYVQDFSLDEFDTFVSVDCGGRSLVKFHEKYPNIFDGPKPFVNIDHHASNDDFGTVNMVERGAASATKVLYDFFRWAGFHITKDIATALLYGLYFDTGSFMHSNTDEAVLMMASDLQSKGADLPLITKSLFKTLEPEKLRLWGRVLERISVNEGGITSSAVTMEDMQECNVSPQEPLTGVIDYLNAVPDAKFCMLLSEDGKGSVKGSVRTLRNDIDLSEVAGMFQGGGHRKASGFAVPGKLVKEERIKIV